MTGITKIVWHEDNVNKLRKLREEGLSATEIAYEFPGATRNAIMGKLHRLKLTNANNRGQRNKPGPKLQSGPKTRRGRLSKKPIIVPVVPAPTVFKNTPPVGGVDFENLGPTTCRSVEGYSIQKGRRLPFYCSNPKEISIVPFCRYHCGIYYRKI